MAITLGDNGASGTLANTGGTFTTQTACPTGQLLIAYLQVYNVSAAVAPAITSNISAGNFSTAGYYFNSGSGHLNMYLYGVSTSSAIPSITVGSLASLGASANGKAGVAWFNGFTGTPTQDASVSATATGTGTSWSGPSPSSAYNPELILGALNCQGANANTDNWSTVPFGGISSTEWAYVVAAAAPPVVETWSGTLGASVTWNAFTVGFYNGVPPSVYNMAWVRA